MLGIPGAAAVAMLALFTLHPWLVVVPPAACLLLLVVARPGASRVLAVLWWFGASAIGSGVAFLAVTTWLSVITGLGDPDDVTTGAVLALLALYALVSATIGALAGVVARWRFASEDGGSVLDGVGTPDPRS